MGVCKDCIYWEEDEEDPSGRLRSCGSPKAKLSYNHSPSDIKEDEVWVEHDEGWGWLMGPKFGCINFFISHIKE